MPGPDETRRPDRDGSHTTAQLIVRARGGDGVAREQLFDRHRRELARWAHGRLPKGARDLRDTEDLVHDALMRALGRMDHFHPEHEGSFLAYLCRILGNLVRDEVRAVRRRPLRQALTDELATSGPSPEADLDAREVVARYDRAMRELSRDQRDAIRLRFELGLPYEAIATEMDRPNVAAVRSLVSRGLSRLAEAMGRATG